MNAISPIDANDDAQEGKGSVSAASRLDTTSRIFCEAFVGNGGRGDLAAIAAGIDEGKAALQACRWLCRKHVSAYIFELCETLIQSSLPVAIRVLIDCANDEKALWKDRIKAAEKIGELCGVQPAAGGVHVNVGVQVNGQQAQAIIASVHEAKARRLSDIPPAMPDKELRQIEGALDALAERIPDRPGGVELQGPPAGTCPLPAPSSAHSPKSDVSCECELCRDKQAPADDGFGAFTHSQGDE